MTIRMKIHHRLSIEPGAYSGATADVFNVEGIAYKVFRSYGVAQTIQRIRDTFKSQIDAYRIAAGDSWLRQHTATYHGCLTIEDILNEDNESVRDLYVLDCCYRMELLPGNDVKFLKKLRRTSICERQSFDSVRQAST